MSIECQMFNNASHCKNKHRNFYRIHPSDLCQCPEPVIRKMGRILFPNWIPKPWNIKGVHSKEVCQFLFQRRKSPIRRRIRKIRRRNNRRLRSKIQISSNDLCRATLKKLWARRQIRPSNLRSELKTSSILKKWPTALSLSSGSPIRCILFSTKTDENFIFG